MAFTPQPPLALERESALPPTGRMTTQPFRFRTHLLVLNGALVLLTVALGAGAAFVAQRHLVQQQLHRAQDDELSAFTQVCRQAVVTRNETWMVAYSQMLANRPGVAWAHFTGADGTFRTHTDLRLLHQPAAGWTPPDEPVVERSAPAQANGAVLGTAALAHRHSHWAAMERKALRDIARRLLWAAGLAGLAGVVVAVGLSGWWARPLQRLAQAARALGQGNLAVRVTPAGSRETHDLAAVFNHMAQQLADLDRFKDEMIAMVSHDLRTPLSGITSYADTLRTERRGPLSDMQKEYLAIIMENADRLNRFVSDMLDLAKIKAGRMDYHPRAVLAETAVRRAADLFRLAVEREGGVMECQCPPGLLVTADEAKLDRVLANLLSNAVKYMPARDGRVAVSAAIVKDRSVFTVTDNGPGVPLQERDRLFQRFSQLQGQGTARSGGTGLGLVIVKTFVEAMGGRVWLDDGALGGTAFHFFLPLAGPAA